jgi:hypothetical protein
MRKLMISREHAPSQLVVIEQVNFSKMLSSRNAQNTQEQLKTAKLAVQRHAH